MKKVRWMYKIGGRLQGFVPLSVLLVVFLGVSVWMYYFNNGAFVFGALLTALILIIMLVCVYHAVFVKILIDENGFYVQTRPGNGVYIPYSRVKRAWISSGEYLNGAPGNSLNYQTEDGETHRFSFLPFESDGAYYLVEQVEKQSSGEKDEKDGASDEAQPYIISGTVYGTARIVIAVILFVFFTVLTVNQLWGHTEAQIILAFSFGVFSVASLGLTIWLLIRRFCFRVEIGKDGFYFQSLPFRRRFYQYRDINSCREERKVSRYRAPAATTSYYYYFVFTDQNGKQQRFLFEKPLYEHEVNVLKQRIETSKESDRS